MQEVKLAVKSKDLLAVSLLEGLQGDLKTLTEENYAKLKNELLTDGFSFAVHVYEDIKTGKLFIIDGHQRIAALKRMSEEGIKIPQVPVVFVEADDLNHAKKKVLASASQYGSFNQKGAEDFIKTIEGISLEQLQANFSMPFVNFEMMDLLPTEQVIVSEHLRNKTNPNEEWVGMPEFDQQDKMPHRSLIVHFENDDDVAKFAALIDQNITSETKSLWYPAQERMDTESKRYVLRKNQEATL